MLWRVTVDLSFEKEDKARAFLKQGQAALLKAKTINSGTPAQEAGFVRLQRCYHDLDPSQPCDNVDYRVTTP